MNGENSVQGAKEPLTSSVIQKNNPSFALNEGNTPNHLFVQLWELDMDSLKTQGNSLMIPTLKFSVTIKAQLVHDKHKNEFSDNIELTAHAEGGT